MSELTTPSTESRTDFLSRPLLAALNLDLEKALYVALIILAFVTRFWGLGDRVMSHDESLHTQFSFQYYDGQGYQHTPLMHGPFLFHVTAVSYWLFGDSDFSARVPVALLGILMVAFPYVLRPWLGRRGALFASFLLLISPYISYYARYIRHDTPVMMWALIVMAATWYYFRTREEKYLWWFAGGVALMFSTKEVAFIYVAIFGSFLVLRLLGRLLLADWFRQALPQLRTPLLILLLALLLLGGGFVGQQLMGAEAAHVTTEQSATEGFAADPSADVTAATAAAAIGQTETIMRWLQIAGIGLLSLALFLAASALRPRLDAYPEFDLIVLYTTLVLPLSSPLLTTIAGWNPRDYSISQCVLENQASLSDFQIFLVRLTNGVCWQTFLQSGMVRSGFFLILALAVGILVGLWWNRRWLIVAAIFHSIFLVLYTSVFTNPGGWTSGMIGSLGYWLEQHEVQRGGQPLYYYLVVMPLYEFLPLLFSLAAVRLWTHKQRIHHFVGYWLTLLLVALLGYSLTNWFYLNTLDPLARLEATRLPALLVAGLVLLGALLYWIFVRRRQLAADEALSGALASLLQREALFGFVPFLTWWMILTWIAYSIAGEKMPWLSTHFVLPSVFLAGWYLNETLRGRRAQEIFGRPALLLWGLSMVLLVAALLALGPLLLGQIQFGDQALDNLTGVGRFLGSLLLAGALFFFWNQARARVDGRLQRPLLILALFSLLSLLTIRFTYMANFPNADYTTEFMVYAHGAPATKSVVMEQVETLSMRLHGDNSIRVAYDNDVSWPFTWYLRNYPNRVYFGENPTHNLRESPVVIVGRRNWELTDPYLGNEFSSREYTFLWWPMEEYRRISWNAILGDPNVPADQRRGLGNSGVRQALWDIFFYRDYARYGQVFGGTYTASQWPLRHDLRLYIRKDMLNLLWDYGISGLGAGALADPYAENELTLTPLLTLNAGGAAGAGLGELAAPRNVAVGPDGRLYVADSGNHRIQVFEADGAAVATWGSFGAQPGEFHEPWGIAVDEAFVYVADTWNHRIQKFTLAGELVGVFGRSGAAADDPDSGGLGLFFGPRALVLLDDNRLLVTDTGNHRLQVLDREGAFLQQVGTLGGALGQLNEPVGISRAPDGSVFLADTWNGRIQQFSPDLFVMNSWFVDAWRGQSINNKPYTAVDSAGRVYVTDPEGYRVLVFTPDGQYLARFGRFGADLNSFGLPNGIFIDGADYVYVVDAGNNRVLKFGPLFGPPPAPALEEGLFEGDTAVDEGLPDDAALEEEPIEIIEPTPTE